MRGFWDSFFFNSDKSGSDTKRPGGQKEEEKQEKGREGMRRGSGVGGFSFGSWFPQVKKDTIATVTITPDEGSPLVIQTNLSYQLTYDDIKDVFPERVKVLNEFYNAVGWPKDRKPLPIIMPEREIRLGARVGAIDSLSFYIQTLVLKQEAERIAAQKLLKSRKSKDVLVGEDEKDVEIDPPLGQRIVYIPMNTGGHWTTLILYITEGNRIGDACYIDPLTSKRTIEYLVKEMDPGFNPIGISEDALHRKLDECSEGLTENLPDYALPQDHLIPGQLAAIDSRFAREKNPKIVHRKFSYFQSDTIACGVLSMELAIQVIKKVYLGGRHIIRPIWCSQELTAQIRAHHIKAVGKGHPFYQRQLVNDRSDVSDPITHALMMYSLNRKERLNEKGTEVLRAVTKLAPGHQRLLFDAFRPQNSGEVNEEEIGPHVTRIRETMLSIRDELMREHEELLETENLLKVQFASLGVTSPGSSEKVSPSTELLDAQEAFELSESDLKERFAAFGVIMGTLYGVIPEAMGEVFDAPLIIEGQHEQVKTIADYLEHHLVKALYSSGHNSAPSPTKRGSSTSSTGLLGSGTLLGGLGLPPNSGRNAAPQQQSGTTHVTTFNDLGF